MEHLAENSNKANHTVFNVENSAHLLPLLDEAWEIKKATNLLHEVGDEAAYVIPMGRVVGTNGETAIKIVVIPGTSIVVTAYPVRLP